MRRITTHKVFPEFPDSVGWPDWSWFEEDWDLGRESGGYFATEAEAIADAREQLGDEVEVVG